MARLWTFFLAMATAVPLSIYLITTSVFRHDENAAGISDSLDSHETVHFLSPHSHQPPAAMPPFSTRGRHIVDQNGTRIKLISINWYGASDGGFVPGGLDVRHRRDIVSTIKRLGFNSVRLPYADELVYTNPVIDSNRLGANSDLTGKTALDVFAAVVNALTDGGLFVIINNHITQARWCCDANVCDGLWKNDHWGPLCRIRQTETSWIDNLETVMRLHVDNSLVIGVDLRNEVRGITDRLLWNSWASAAEQAASRLHIMQPEWLMFVEGVSSANDVSGARWRPVTLAVPHKLVYSAHVYGWSGWGSMVPFFKRPYESFADEMRRKWGYLLTDEVAPVWIGEIGAPRNPSKGDIHYWRNLMLFVQEIDVDFAYWALNPRKWERNQTESYSLLKDDWETPIIDYRLLDMLELMPIHL